MMRILFFVLLVLVLLGLALILYLHHPKFGQLPEGASLEIVQASPNYRDGEFKNEVETPLFTTDQSFMEVLIDNIRADKTGLTPESAIPSEPVNFKTLDPDRDLVVWLGHSSYYIQINGLRILLDPVFSQAAAPVSFANRAYAGTTVFAVDDFPELDLLLITHDHWDHLDYPTVTGLKDKVARVITPLGVGSYFRGWGFPDSMIQEGDWYDQFAVSDDVTVLITPARHYSGRMLERRQTFWSGFVLESPERRMFFSGDSGYGPHFAEIARRFRSFDLVALDQGQYDSRWANIHMTPEEAAQAAEELGAARLLPGHVGKFTLARHTWDEPFERMVDAAKGRSYDLLTPVLGTAVSFEDGEQTPPPHWWRR